MLLLSRLAKFALSPSVSSAPSGNVSCIEQLVNIKLYVHMELLCSLHEAPSGHESAVESRGNVAREAENKISAACL